MQSIQIQTTQITTIPLKIVRNHVRNMKHQHTRGEVVWAAVMVIIRIITKGLTHQEQRYDNMPVFGFVKQHTFSEFLSDTPPNN
jgi:hypothetical protein